MIINSNKNKTNKLAAFDPFFVLLLIKVGFIYLYFSQRMQEALI